MFSHSFFRYIPSNDERKSFFKFVEKIDTTDDSIPKIDDHNCIDVVTNNENGQIRIKNHSAPEYTVSKYVGWTLFLPPVEKQNKEPIFVVFHKSSFSHKKVEFDEFLEPIDKRYDHEDWKQIINKIKRRFDLQKQTWSELENKSNCRFPDGQPLFKSETEFDAFSMGRRAYFLYHLVIDYKFRHLIRDLNIAYTE